MSRKTSNHGLIQLELNDNANFPQLLNDTFATIDKGIAPFYVATLNSSNVYKVTTGLSLTALQDGFSVRVAIPSASTGATSLIIDSISAIAIKKVNGNAVSNLKVNGVYSLTYYNGNFILASGSDDSDSTSVGTDGSNVLAPNTYIGSDGEVHTGTMVNNEAVSATLGINGTYTIPKGYHNGSGKVTQSVTTRGTYTNAVSIAQSNGTAFVRIPQGAYFTNGGSGYPEIQVPDSSVMSAYGITANKIVSGNTIGGITGTASITMSTQGTTNVFKSGTTVTIGFTPTIVVAIGAKGEVSFASPIGNYKGVSDTSKNNFLNISISGNNITFSTTLNDVNITYYAIR